MFYWNDFAVFATLCNTIRGGGALWQIAHSGIQALAVEEFQEHTSESGISHPKVTSHVLLREPKLHTWPNILTIGQLHTRQWFWNLHTHKKESMHTFLGGNHVFFLGFGFYGRVYHCKCVFLFSCREPFYPKLMIQRLWFSDSWQCIVFADQL